ncbi:MAG: histidine kinase [Bacteroidota bacterium]
MPQPLLKRYPLSLYWTCQLIGWGAVAPYWFYYLVINNPPLESLAVVLFQAGLQLFLTDQYRRLAHRWGWLRLPAAQQIPRIILAWLVLISLYLLMVYVMYNLQHQGKFWEHKVWLGALAGGTRYHAIWLLAFHLYHFAQQMADERAAAARNAQLAAEAQLAKLSNELNPHFLFNALNGIKALTRENPVNARQGIDRLAELLRYSLRQSERSLVPFPEEKSIIDEYISLEKMRLEERLTLHWHLPETSAQLILPPLSLHTLVENAVKHGITKLPEGGAITVILTQTVSHSVFTVTNDGTYSPDTPGSGLANLRQRLQLQYGTSASITINNLPQESSPRVRAILSIPL